MPDRSGLPSGVRGVGASKFTSPFASRGTVESGIIGHWAGTDAVAAATAAMTISFFIGLLRGISRP
jgi:hypothetical protein